MTMKQPPADDSWLRMECYVCGDEPHGRRLRYHMRKRWARFLSRLTKAAT